MSGIGYIVRKCMLNKNFNLKNKIILLFLLNVLLGINYSYGSTVDCPSTPSTPYTFNLASIAVSSDLPVGQDIPGTQKSISFSGKCNASGNTPGDPIIACYYGIGSEISGMKGVYDSGVPGVGIALTNDNGQRVSGNGQGCDTRGTALGYLDSNNNFNFTVRLSLVKTSETIQSSSLLESNTQFGLGVYGKSGIGGSQNYVAYTGDVAIRTQTCTVSNKTINVALGDYNISDFPSIGSVSTNKSFNVELNCDSGANVSIRIDGTSVPGTQGVVALSSGSDTAEGVGVQILNNNQPITIGQQWQVASNTPKGSLNIPFTGRYYRTGDVTEGPANAIATFTMIYS